MARTAQINIALPPALIDALDSTAEKHGFTRSELARIILAERLAGTIHLVTDQDVAKKLAAMKPRGRPKRT
jgi:metal-responsive CopG/Arc/MetJ family transcriptional regulator